MKKTIGKPENWQDFESLCKKLWGEIWSIPNEIKKNGRLGQEQSGVDVFGKPKGETEYWGIQAKGKSDYTNAKLTEKEISKEIEKARNFNPPLQVYIIASTTNKDSKVEEFIRIKDFENQKAESFKILLFCWEDILDLLEDNPDVLNWYLHGISQKGKCDFNILFNNMEEKLILNPTFEKTITSFILTDKSDAEFYTLTNLCKNTGLSFITESPFAPSNRINKSWCKFDLIMVNSGSKVIEDWKVNLKFFSGVARLDTGSRFLPRVSLTDHVDDENKTIKYRPINNSPLIQKDNKSFEILLLPDTNSEQIIIEWELLARDFYLQGEFHVKIEPNYIVNRRIEEVNKESNLRVDETYISYHITEKE